MLKKCTRAGSLAKSAGPPSEWRSGLKHCIAVLEASLQSQVRSQAVSQTTVTGNTIGRLTIGPAKLQVRGGCGRGALHGSSRSRDSLWRVGACRLTLVIS